MICDNAVELAVTFPRSAAELGLGGGMSKLNAQLLANSSQVRDAEKRLAIQHVFLERLRGSARDTRSAEQALEVMRDILRGLYQERSQLLRKVGSHKPALGTPKSTSRARKGKIRRARAMTCVEDNRR
jgi:hypothetical protein